jgi:BlaI family penicillinase repressor
VYYPAISKSEYGQFILKETFKGLFNGSLNQMMSCFVKNKDVSLQELEELKQLLESEIEKQKQ